MIDTEKSILTEFMRQNGFSYNHQATETERGWAQGVFDTLLTTGIPDPEEREVPNPNTQLLSQRFAAITGQNLVDVATRYWASLQNVQPT